MNTQWTWFLLINLSFILTTKGELLDLSYPYEEGYTMTWLASEQFSLTTEKQGYTPEGFWVESHRMSLGEHSGTHMDAPVHFNEKGWSVDEIPLTHLIGQAVVVDIREKASKYRNAVLTTDDLMKWFDEHGPLPDNAVVLVLTGHGSKYGNIIEYFGSTNLENVSFPGISVGAAQLLSAYQNATGRRVIGVGIDSPSIDSGDKTKIPGTHIELYKHNIYGLENVANIEKLPTTGAKVMIFPMKIKGGSGGPVRIIAEFNTNSATKSASMNMLFGFSLTIICYALA